MMRSTMLAASTATTVLLLGGLGAAPAFAVEWTPGTLPELQTALSTCADGDIVRLGADITALDTGLLVACDATLDLNGFALAASDVQVTVEHVVTIDDSVGGGELYTPGSDPEEYSGLAGIGVPTGAGLVIRAGTVTVAGGRGGAGIGGGGSQGAGDIRIEGGAVSANGGLYGAGIGGGYAGDGGTVVITGGTVSAVAGQGGAGIGSGESSSGGGQVTVTGGTVTAVAGHGGAGIGGGLSASGATVDLAGGTITAIGADVSGTSAVGAGAGAPEFGSLRVGGTLRVPQGLFTILDSDAAGPEVVVEATGQLVGTEVDPTIGATIDGGGQIQNDGVIALDESHVGVQVTGNNFLASFDAQTGDPAASVRLYAPDFASGYRTVPAPPDHMVWNTSPDGLGQFFTETTRIFTDVTLYAVDDAFWQFAVALEECTDGSVVQLDRDLAGENSLMIGCDLTLDLNGFSLLASDVQVGVDNELVIEDTGVGGELATPPFDPDNYSGAAGIGVPSGAGLVVRGGTVTVAGGRGGAGIGGGGQQAAGFIRIEGGTVAATGGHFGAGIGGGFDGDGGDVEVAGGTVAATGGRFGAGIGGGDTSTGGGTLTVTGGAVTAAAGHGGAGIGGGVQGSGADVDIAGGTVTAIGDLQSGTSAVGAGQYASEFGSLRLAGTLRVPQGTLSVLDSDAAAAEVVIESGGQLLGTVADPTTGATVDGDGQIDNHGVIALQEALVGVEVNDHDFLVSFDAQDGSAATSVRLYAPDFASGYRTIPEPPSGAWWNTEADGSGDWFDETTPVTGDVTLYAATDVALVLTADDDTVAEGGSLTFSVTGTTHDGRPVDTSGVVLTSSVATDRVDGLTVTFPTASPHVITATLRDVSTSVTVQVTPAKVTPPTGDATGDLSSTGTNPLPSLVLGLLLLLAGAVAVVLGRRATA